MLDDIVNLQDNKVKQVLDVLNVKNEVVFKAPTGSGKTFMMASLMNKLIQNDSNIVFIVSSLSKGGLAKQNADKFKEYRTLKNLKVNLITTKTDDESSLHIPMNYNVYVLPLGLNKKEGKLDRGALLNFLINTKKTKKVYLIKDESHIATNNLDELKSYFDKTINFSATPNLKRGQYPDVEITEIEAEQVNLIKSIVPNYDDDTEQNRESAIIQFKNLKNQYLEKLGINPCLIIQISNKDKAESEIDSLKRIINKHELKWMLILDGKGETNDSFDKKGKTLPFEKWTDFAKEKTSSIDIIIFKMVLTEGWDIPRACMLYQIRDTASEQLTEQVIGRVRRNPCLSDYEQLNDEQKSLIKHAYVYSVKPKDSKEKREVRLVGGVPNNIIQESIKIKTTKIIDIGSQKTFNVSTFLNGQPTTLTGNDIFSYYRKLEKFSNEMNTLYKGYVNTFNEWFIFMDNSEEISLKIKDTMSNYAIQYDKEVNFPMVSYYIEEKNKISIGDWLWQRTDKDEHFSFDSETEAEWAHILFELIKINPKNNMNRIIKSVTVKEEEEEIEKYLIGKNFLPNSEIKYEYYLNGVKSSYPDFILKDYKENIHIFESKGLNSSKELSIDKDEYVEKVRALKFAYQKISSVVEHYFYIPIKENNDWTIYQYKDGNEVIFYSKKDFVNFMKTYN